VTQNVDKEAAGRFHRLGMSATEGTVVCLDERKKFILVNWIYATVIFVFDIYKSADK